jgi:hypothetical protein
MLRLDLTHIAFVLSDRWAQNTGRRGSRAPDTPARHPARHPQRSRHETCIARAKLDGCAQINTRALRRPSRRTRRGGSQPIPHNDRRVRSSISSSRIRPANDRETSRIHLEGQAPERAGQRPNSRIVAVQKAGLRHSQGGDTSSSPVGTTQLRSGIGPESQAWNPSVARHWSVSRATDARKNSSIASATRRSASW